MTLSFSKKITLSLLFLLGVTLLPMGTLAQDGEAMDFANASQTLQDELIAMGQTTGVEEYANAVMTDLVSAMQSAQSSATSSLEALKKRVQSLPENDERLAGMVEDPQDIQEFFGWNALGLITDTEQAVEAFTNLDATKHLSVQLGMGNTPPQAMPSSEFTLRESESKEAMIAVNRVLLSPKRPGNAPSGDLLEDFIPQLIRQLFRFAWLAVLVAFVVSGILLVISFSNEEYRTKAKETIYYTLLGFAFISLAFAIVKGITDIDFFRFV